MKFKSGGYYILASALIWGAVIIGCALKLKGTECYNEISFILYAGVVCHLLFIWPFIGTRLRKKEEQK